MSSQRRYDLVIFDYDGTLADSARWFACVLNEAAKRYGFRQTTREELESLRDMDTHRLLSFLGVRRWKLPFIARHMRKLAARDHDQIPMFEGAERTLEALREVGIRLALVTSNTEANVQSVLGERIMALFDYRSCGASTFGKARKFRRVLAAAHVDPQRAIAIGDEVRDIEAADAAGIASGAVAWGYGSPRFLASRHPTVMFESFDDIVAKLVHAG